MSSRDFEAAADAYRRGDYAAAFRGFEAAAAAPNADALAMLGYLSQNGQGCACNLPQAVAFYEKASALGHAAAAWNLSALANEAGNLAEARRWCLLAAERGHADAWVPTARYLAAGLGGDRDLGAAKGWLEKAALAGVREAMTGLGRMLATEDGAEDPALREAAQWFAKAAERGDPAAQFNLALFYEQGLGVEADMSSAASWYRRAAKQGQLEAQLNLGLLCQASPEGLEGFAADLESEGAFWVSLAAEAGLEAAQGIAGGLASTLRLGTLAEIRARVAGFEAKAETDPGPSADSGGF